MNAIYLVVLLAGVGTSNVESNLLKLHNHYRRSAPDLSIDPTLKKAAQDHANWMARNRVMQHNQGLRSLLSKFPGVSENVAAGHRSSTEVVWGWMNSDGHRSAILDPRFRFVGFGVARSAAGRLYWCTVFGAGGQMRRAPPQPMPQYYVPRYYRRGWR